MIYDEDYTTDIDGSLKNIQYSNVYCCMQECLTYFYRHTVFDFEIYKQHFTNIPLIKLYIGDLYLTQPLIEEFFTNNPIGSLMCFMNIDGVQQSMVNVNTFQEDDKIMQEISKSYTATMTLNILCSAKKHRYTIDNKNYEILAYDFANLLASKIGETFSPHYMGMQAIREKYRVVFNLHPSIAKLHSLEISGNIYRYNVRNMFRSEDITKINKKLDKITQFDIDFKINGK